MQKRPILSITIGYLIGICWGLYCKSNIALLYLIIIFIYFIIKKFGLQKKEFHIFSIKRYFRYLKIWVNTMSILLISISSIISCSITQNKNNEYIAFCNSMQDDISLEARVIDNGEKREYSYRYLVKIEELNQNKKYKGKKLYINIKEESLKYGDKIQINGKYIKPATKRNEYGFNYELYLKSKGIYGTIQSENVVVIGENSNSKIFTLSNNLFLLIKQKIGEVLKDKYASLVLGIVLGYTNNMEEELTTSFQESSLSHVLAVSGMHITYCIIGLSFLTDKKIGKRKGKYIILVFLIFYMFLTNFTPSVVRAIIMGVIMIFAGLIYRKQDTWTSLSLSLLIILFTNPFALFQIGLQLSYLGTIGILLFYKDILYLFKKIFLKQKKHEKIKYKKIKENLLEVLSVIFSAQIAIIPIILINFHTISLTFFVSNFLVNFIAGPILGLGFIQVFLCFIGKTIATIFSYIYISFLWLLIQISYLGQSLPFHQIYWKTPNIFEIFIYYISFLILNIAIKIIKLQNNDTLKRRIKNIVYLIKDYLKTRRKKIYIFTSFFVIIILVSNIFPKDLKIHFIDVGQGDSMLVRTPYKKSILIDGGGTESKTFDTGIRTVLPFILSKQITKLDYVLISHFDSDHVGGILSILQKIKVDEVIIAKQKQTSENFISFLKIVDEKNIKVKVVEKGDRIELEKNLYIDILWPQEKQITENPLNNNAVVAKLVYRNFSMLLTGDIEELAEKEILELYGQNNILKSDILKVAHHGSKTSSTKEFLKKVNPKIALIGVGENNVFGHPNNEVLERIKNLRN